MIVSSIYRCPAGEDDGTPHRLTEEHCSDVVVIWCGHGKCENAACEIAYAAQSFAQAFAKLCSAYRESRTFRPPLSIDTKAP